MKPCAVVWDLDGTIANIDHRVHYLTKVPRQEIDWEKFHSERVNDSIYEWAYIVNHALADESCFIRQIIVTCCNSAWRELTEQWLEDYDFKYEEMIMRPNGNWSNDYEMKEFLYKKYVEPKYNVLFVFEDRNKCVDLWRGLGLVCLQCKEGNY